jgi:hypothetical protein
VAISEKSKEKIIKKYKDKVDSYIRSYLKQTIKTGNTPDLATMQLDIKAYIVDLAQNDKELSFYSSADIQSVINECVAYGNSTSSVEYQKSLSETPRNINGVSPISRNAETGAPTNKNTVIQQIKNVLDSGLSKFLLACSKSKCCPDEAQMSAYIDSMASSAMRQLIPSNMPDKDKADITKAIEKYKKTLLGRYRMYANGTVITHTMPSEESVNEALGKKKTQITTTKKLRENFVETNTTFSGCDMLVNAMIWINGKKCVDVVMGSLATVSYSVFQQKFPINAIGNVNAKDYVMGPRTIAGSLVFIVFNQHWAQDLLKQFSEAMGWPKSKKVLIDEIAPIHLTISMCNEYGFRSRLAIYNVRLFSEGQVMSINDMYTENTFQYVALNIDYLTDVYGENEDLNTNTQTTISQSSSLPTLAAPNDGGAQVEQEAIDAAIETFAIKENYKTFLSNCTSMGAYNTMINTFYNNQVDKVKQALDRGQISREQYNSIIESYQTTMRDWIDQGLNHFKTQAAKTVS